MKQQASAGHIQDPKMSVFIMYDNFVWGCFEWTT